MAGQGDGAGNLGRQGGGGRSDDIRQRLRFRRAFYFHANPQRYIFWMLERYAKAEIQEAVTEHFYNEGRNAVGNGGAVAANWTGKTPRNLQIRVARGVAIDLPVLVNSGALRRYVANSVVLEYNHTAGIVHVSLNPRNRPSYAAALHTGAFIKKSPFGPIQLAERPLVRFTLSSYRRVVNTITSFFVKHWTGDPGTPGPHG